MTNDAISTEAALPAHIQKVLKQLAESPVADQVQVFGSMAKGKAAPGDVDVFIDLRPARFQDERQLEPFRALIRIAASNYGSFDPFLRFQNCLLVRNDDARGWMNAKNVKTLRADMDRDGVALKEVLERTGLAETAPKDAERAASAAKFLDDLKPKASASPKI